MIEYPGLIHDAPVLFCGTRHSNGVKWGLYTPTPHHDLKFIVHQCSIRPNAIHQQHLWLHHQHRSWEQMASNGTYCVTEGGGGGFIGVKNPWSLRWKCLSLLSLLHALAHLLSSYFLAVKLPIKEKTGLAVNHGLTDLWTFMWYTVDFEPDCLPGIVC